MSTYTVESAAKKADKPDTGYGPKMVVSLALRDEAGEVKHAEWYTNAATPIPEAGSVIEGDVTQGKYGLDFKKARTGGGLFGPRAQDPQRAKRILRQHSQDMALRTIQLGVQTGLVKLPGDGAGLLDMIARTADWFDRDAEKAAAA